MRVLLNVEGAIGLLFLARVLWRQHGQAAAPEKAPRTALAMAALLGLTAAVFWRELSFPFFTDDYKVMAIFRAPHVPAFVYDYTPPIFFRPLTFLFFRAEWWWAGENAMRWHAVSLALHLVNCWLVYELGRRLFERHAIGFWAAAIFAWHGSTPEVVAWPVLVFDLLATGFVLASLLLFVRGRMAPALVCEAAALLAKESAYCLPALALLVVLWRTPSRWRRAIPFWVVAAAIFAWRWRVLGSIGGYAEHAGETLEITHLSLLGAIKVLALRLWALLWFPVNWTAGLNRILLPAALLGLLAALLMSATRAARRDLLFGAIFIVLAALPALTRLLVGADLQGARYLYLPLVGFGLLLGVALAGMESRRVRLAAAGALLAFNLIALETNLGVWGEVGRQAEHVCESVAAQIGPAEDQVTIAGAPYFLRGAQFLITGLPECIAMHGRPETHVRMAPKSSGDATFVWDDARQELVRR